jgi:phosphatidylinositol alpha-1,6-mannosyltransferase
VEAALYGKPSIVSNNGGTAEFVLHGENGLLVNPYNQNDVANAMECLIKDEQLTAKMGFKARDRALSEFTIEKSTENLARAIRML